MSDYCPKGWGRIKLGEIGKFSTSSVDKKRVASELPVRLLNYMDVYRNCFLDSSMTFMEVTAAPQEVQRARVLKGDMFFTPSSETPDDIGRSAVFLDEPANLLHSYHTVRYRIYDNSRVDLRFRGLMANSAPVLKHYSLLATGSTRYTLSLADFESTSLCLPPLGEQRRIVEILEALDTAIHETEAIIAKLKAVKQGLLHDLLTRGIDANGELRPPRSEAPHLYKPSPLGWIPKEWSFGPLQCWLTGKPKNGYSPQEAGEWTGIQMLGLGCLTDEGFAPVQLKLAPRGDKRLATALLADGDLLMSRSNTRDLVGLAGVYRDVGTPCTYPDLMMRLRTSPETSSEFLQFVMRSSMVRRQIQARAVGTSGSMVKITGRIVSNLTIAMPQKSEQERILSYLATGDFRLDTEQATVAALRNIKSGLMDDLLTGRVRVTSLLQEAQHA